MYAVVIHYMYVYCMEDSMHDYGREQAPTHPGGGGGGGGGARI